MEDNDGPTKPKRQKKNQDEKQDFPLSDADDDSAVDSDDTVESSEDEEKFEPLHFIDVSSRSLESTNGPSTSGSTSKWTATGKMRVINNDVTNKFNGPTIAEPIDYFNFFFEEDFLQDICNLTNAQAEARLLSEKTTKESRITRWKELTVSELKVFLGLLFHTGTIQLAHIHDYWKLDRLFAIPIFGQQMGRNRFLIIMTCLYFTYETDSKDPLHKISYVIDYFNNKMKECYYPLSRLSMDDSMVIWRGRLTYRQFIKNRRNKYGVKVYMLTEPGGVVLKCLVRNVNIKDTAQIVKDNSKNIVMEMMEDNLEKGHEVYLDQCYNSVTLAKNLLDKNTYCTGTLRPNLKTNPKDVVQKKLEQNENISRFHEGVHVGKWNNTKRDMMYITTKYNNVMVQNTSQRKYNTKHHPLTIAKLNGFMNELERQDKLFSFYPFEKQNTVWYLKIAIHVFQMLLLNSFHMYNKYSGPKMRFYDYRLAVIGSLLPAGKGPDESILRTPARMGVPHKIARIAEKNPNGRIKRKHCRHCYKQKKRSDTTWNCVGCPDLPGLCVECFDPYHVNMIP